jgi:uncharacterized protein YlxW (UPF0749 family)
MTDPQPTPETTPETARDAMPDDAPESTRGPDGPDGSPAEEQTGRARLRHALLHPGRSQVVVAVLLAVVAFAAIVQVRTTEDDDTYAGYREQDLVNVLSGLAGAQRRARAEITRLETARDQLVSDTNAERVALEQASTEADALSVLAGLVPVTGPGIRITITEVTGRVTADTMLDMVQGLRIASAEAMQVNGQVRLVAQSSFTDAEGGLVVDGQLLSSPYVVDVIGDANALAGAMSILQGGPRVALQEDGAEVEVETLPSLDIESVRTPVDPEYAQPEDAQ